MTRKEAQRLGSPTYIGKPCKHCGGTLRLTLSCNCVPCFKEGKKRRRRERYHKNAPQRRKLRRVAVVVC